MQNLAELTPDEIRQLRQAMSMSQAALGDALGSSSRTIEDWEAGRRRAPWMLRLAVAALATRLSPETENLLRYRSARRDYDRSMSELSRLSNVDLRSMNDDQIFEWANRIKIQSLSCSSISNYIFPSNNDLEFVIYRDKAGEYRASFSDNGLVLLSTEGYKSKTSAMNAVESLKRNGPSATIGGSGGHIFEIYRDRTDSYRVRFKYNAEIMFSSEGFPDLMSANQVVQLVKASSPSAITRDNS